MTHDEICLAVRLEFTQTNRGRLWYNRVGKAWRKKVLLFFGLAKGSSDLIGFEFVSGVPVFCSVEVKSDGYKKLSSEQKDWLNMVIKFGGRAYIARPEKDKYNLEEWK